MLGIDIWVWVVGYVAVTAVWSWLSYFRSEWEYHLSPPAADATKAFFLSAGAASLVGVLGPIIWPVILYMILTDPNRKGKTRTDKRFEALGNFIARKKNV